MSTADLLHLIAALLVVSALFAWAETQIERGLWAVNTLIVIVLLFYIQLVIQPTPIPPEPPIPPVTGGDFGGYRPQHQGFGATTRGGRGGPVCVVDTLTIDSSNTFGASGDLADCVAPRPGCDDSWQACARTVVFGVSGTMAGVGQISITSPYLTVAGQTSPRGDEGSGDAGVGGVTLEGARFLIDTHDVVVQHLRIRRPPSALNALSVGDAGDAGDNSHVRNVILDHVSVSWAHNVNNYLQAYPGSGNVLLSDSLIYEGLWDNAWGGIGAGVGGDSTIVRNVFAQHWSRQPIWGSVTRIILANNVTFNGTDNSHGNDTLPAFFGDADGSGNPAGLTEAMILWNVLIPGPDSGGVRAMLGFSKKQGSVDAGSKAFLEGNVGPGIVGPGGDGQWVATVCTGGYGDYPNAATCGPGSNLRTDAPFAWWNDLKMGTLTANVKDIVLGNAGARPLERDAADARIIANIYAGEGTHYLDWNSIVGLGGMPILARRTRTVALPANPTGPGIRTLSDGSKNTVLEDWLETDPGYGAQRLERRAVGT